MKIIFVFLFAMGCFAQAQVSDRLPVHTFKAGQLQATVYSSKQLEDISAKRLWLIKGRVYGGAGFDPDKAIWQGSILCSFYLPSGVIAANQYKLYYTETDRELNTDHLEFITENNKMFGVTCFKKQGWPALTLSEMNIAFGAILKFTPVPQ